MRPLAEIQIEGPHQDPTAHNTDSPDAPGAALRERTRERLLALGFRPSESLPTSAHRAFVPGTLRPRSEIVARAWAVTLLNLWVYAPEDVYPSEDILAEFEANPLREVLSEDEAEILEMSREEAGEEFGNTMGWTQENLWSLVWVLGFENEPPLGEPLIDSDIFRPILDFLPKIGGDLKAYTESAPLRSEQEVKALEDLFYCAHNAVRSAQMGSAHLVPEGFHPMVAGGAIHERRHALTWALSPGTPWDETDLST